MAREIKFRVWDKVEKKMRYNPVLIQYEKITDGTGFKRVYNSNRLELKNPAFGCYGFTNKYYESEPDGFDLPDREERLPNEVIIMQFTGLKDRNGKEIYEGDVLKHRSLIHTIMVHAFHGFRFMFGKDQLVAADTAGEVIGNIYENPELLAKP